MLPAEGGWSEQLACNVAPSAASVVDREGVHFLMARKTVVTLVDDIDGSDAVRTVTFSLDGTNYEIDLNSHNLDTLTTALDPFIKNAHTAGKRRTPSGSTGTTAPSKNLAGVRVWARENGYTVSDRGRVPAEILAAYQQRN